MPAQQDALAAGTCACLVGLVGTGRWSDVIIIVDVMRASRRPAILSAPLLLPVEFELTYGPHGGRDFVRPRVVHQLVLVGQVGASAVRRPAAFWPLPSPPVARHLRNIPPPPLSRSHARHHCPRTISPQELGQLSTTIMLPARSLASTDSNAESITLRHTIKSGHLPLPSASLIRHSRRPGTRRVQSSVPSIPQQAPTCLSPIITRSQRNAW